ncbi:hypothetical protein FACS189428_3840 [Clostridia bacterium]|nr:hypothetical protein FACS189428_3840 [Clostridia bacterium]
MQLVAKPLSVFVGNEEANKTVNLPFDYGYFFLGSGYNSSMIINMKTNFKKSISTDKKQIVHLFEENGIKKSDLKHLFGELVDGDFYQAFQNIFLILKLKILLAFGKVLDYPNDDEVLSKFIASINTYNQYASVSQEENPLIGLIRERFAKYRYFSDEELGMFPISS